MCLKWRPNKHKTNNDHKERVDYELDRSVDTMNDVEPVSTRGDECETD